MRTSSLRRSVRATVVAAVVGGVALGLLPRSAVGGAQPPTVMHTVRVSLADLVPSSARTMAAPGDAVRVRRSAWTETARMCAPIRFTMVGIVWRQAGGTEVPAALGWGENGAERHARVVADPAEGPDPGSPDDSGLVGTPPLWTGEARCLEFRLKLPPREWVAEARVAFINTSGTATDPSPLASFGSAVVGFLDRLGAALAPAPAAAQAGRPPIITRPEWGADEDLRNCGPDYADAVKMAYVHHTAGSNSYTRQEADDVVRGVYAYHTNGRGYCDIAYQFLIDRFGRIYEGRFGGMAQPVNGAHAMGFNTGTVGVSAMGTFNAHPPPARVIRAFKRLLAWRLDVAHVNPTVRTWMTSAGGSTTHYDEGERVRLRTISGHKDTGITDCPGRKLYKRLDSIRTGALGIGLPKMWRPRQSDDRVEIGENTVEWSARLSRRLSWTVEVRDEQDVLVRELSGRGQELSAEWGGRNELGLKVPEGRYRVLLRAEDDAGGQVRRKEFFVRVVNPDVPLP